MQERNPIGQRFEPRLLVSFPLTAAKRGGEGTEPIPDHPPEPAGSSQRRIDLLPGLLILLVEDNAAGAEAMSDYLEMRGYRVILARNGREAVEMATSQHPDLILMDVQMPVMDGLQATRLIRTHAAMATTPIIALTGLAMAGDMERCLAAGADGYLSKPINLRELVQTIESHLPKWGQLG